MTSSIDKANILKEASDCLLEGDVEAAGKVIREEYPFAPIKREARRYTPLQMMEQFFKDGFIDRYFGTRLVNPGMLYTLSLKLPEDFPYQANWKMSECHMAYYDNWPTIDHIVPIARGGSNSPDNWVTTSMKGNFAKSNFTLEQLNWHLYPAGDIDKWDGLSENFVRIAEQEDLLDDPIIARWYKPTKVFLGGRAQQKKISGLTVPELLKNEAGTVRSPEELRAYEWELRYQAYFGEPFGIKIGAAGAPKTNDEEIKVIMHCIATDKKFTQTRR